MDQLKYPIGKFEHEGEVSEELRSSWLSNLAAQPSRLREAVAGLNDEQLDTPYRDGGWTVRQVVHHVADSHMNSFIRFKLALTEETPVIKPYEEHLWAELADGRTMPIDVSLRLMEAVHERWVVLLESLTADQWQRAFIHPARGQSQTLEYALGSYAWHGSHHIAHITSLRESKGW